MEGFEANHLGSLGNTGPMQKELRGSNEGARERGPGKGAPESPRDSSPEVAVAGATDCHVKPSGAEPGLVVTLGQI
ncbi:unnamed protein product [Arctogadus glacialis]